MAYSFGDWGHTMYIPPPPFPKRASFSAVPNFSYQIQAYQPRIAPYKFVS